MHTQSALNGLKESSAKLFAGLGCYNVSLSNKMFNDEAKPLHDLIAYASMNANVFCGHE